MKEISLEQLTEKLVSSFGLDHLSKEGMSVKEDGEVVAVGDGIASLSGLNQVLMGEVIEFETGQKGLILNLEKDLVGVALLGSSDGVSAGMRAHRLQQLLTVPTGDAILGRTVSPLGEPLDGQGPLEQMEPRPLEVKAPGVMDRQSVFEPLHTGLKSIDSMIPIGRGQRELIIGDRQTGKTAIALDTIINQKGQGVKCFYVAIGQKQSTIVQVQEKLKKAGAYDYTTIVAAGASDSAILQYLSPYAGTAMAEFFRDRGDAVLIIYDDLTRHAQAYRELSLLLRRPPGREAFPGDVFYIHSRLLERACKLSQEKKGGSLTALPIVETLAGDVSAYIPTNVISITDGQIYLESDLFYSGFRPAVNAGLSVSRVGGAAQTNAMKQVAGQIRLTLAQYRDLASFAQFASDLDEATLKQIHQGQLVTEILKQDEGQPLSAEEQVGILFLVTRGYLDHFPLEQVRDFEAKFYERLKEDQVLPTFKKDVKSGQKVSEKGIQEMVDLVSQLTEEVEGR